MAKMASGICLHAKGRWHSIQKLPGYGHGHEESVSRRTKKNKEVWAMTGVLMRQQLRAMEIQPDIYLSVAHSYW